MDYFYHPKKQIIVSILDENIVEFKNREKDIDFVRCYLVFHDLTTDRVFIQEEDDFHEEFLIFSEDEMPLLQEWYGIDDIAFKQLKNEFLKLMRG